MFFDLKLLDVVWVIEDMAKVGKNKKSEEVGE
jgi:hypothetical protein